MRLQELMKTQLHCQRDTSDLGLTLLDPIAPCRLLLFRPITSRTFSRKRAAGIRSRRSRCLTRRLSISRIASRWVLDLARWSRTLSHGGPILKCWV